METPRAYASTPVQVHAAALHTAPVRVVLSNQTHANVGERDQALLMPSLPENLQDIMQPLGQCLRVLPDGLSEAIDAVVWSNIPARLPATRTLSPRRLLEAVSISEYPQEGI